MSDNESPHLATSRQSRSAELLDAAMAKVAEQIKEGPISSSLLREIVQLCKAAGVEIAEHGQSMSPSTDSVLASLADVDLDTVIGSADEYKN